MTYASALSGDKNNANKSEKEKFYRKNWFWVVCGVLIILLTIGGFLYKTGYVLNKISQKDNSIIGSLLGVVPFRTEEVTEEEGRTNVLLIGMRGQNVPGGGLLSDTIMVLSIKPEENKVAMISIPRDLYVKIPGENYRNKINSVYAHGEENGKQKGLDEMKQIVTDVTGLKMHYAVALNFNGFRQLVDAVGGIDITLETAFWETSQFVLGNECGGEFTLPKGKNHLDGETTLCYVRARENTSDFDRAKRQQVVLKALKDKLVSIGTLTDFGKLNSILNAVGDNVRTDMSSKEMRAFYDEYSSLSDAEIFQRVFENSQEGFLMVPTDAPEEAGYILIPRAGYDNYSQMHQVCQEIFTLPTQTDIEPVKQYQRPAPKPTDEETEKKDKDSKKKDSKDTDEDEKK